MIGVIADDLTGAAELGAVGLRHGLRAEIVRIGKPSGRADLVCVDTDSRSCEPAVAAKRAAVAAKMLHTAGAAWIYKKVDSVLRGQVTPEVEAVMKQLKLNRALLLPANPSLGRTIHDGQYFVQGRPIHKTEFAHDPEYPRRSSQVVRLLAAPENFLLRVVNGDRSLAAGTIVIGEASTSADVQSWAEYCDATMLPAGGSEFFNALLAGEVSHLPKSDQGLETAAGPEFFISGTSTRQARQFVQAEKRCKTPVFSLPQELAWGAEFLPEAIAAVAQRVVAGFQESPRVILAVGLPPVRDLLIARKLSKSVVLVAELVMQQVPVARVYAEGGATAAELVRRMGWSRLTVLRELAPGVATLAVDSGESSILLTIKPGTYAWPAEWTSRPVVC